MLKAARDYGWLIGVAGFVLGAVALGVVVYARPVSEVPATTKVVTEVVAPASPGLVTAIEVCKMGEVREDEDLHTGETKYTAVYGLSTVQYIDNDLLLAVVDGQTVRISEEVAKCLRDRS